MSAAQRLANHAVHRTAAAVSDWWLEVIEPLRPVTYLFGRGRRE